MTTTNYTASKMFRHDSAFIQYLPKHISTIIGYLSDRAMVGCEYCDALLNTIVVQSTRLRKGSIAVAQPHVARLKYYPKYLKNKAVPAPEGFDAFMDAVNDGGLGVASGDDVYSARVESLTRE